MNYYEHHIGDYDKNTAHLTACEDGIYSRLIRRYYDKEKPLPADVTEVKRLARARSRDERAAVDAVLREFFHLEADGWHHDKCDEVIAAYKAGEPEREAKKKNEDTRLAKHRAERAELFAVINAAGQHMAWNTPMADLRAAAERIRNGNPAAPATPPAPRPETPPATGTATPATATQTPFPNPHTPTTKDKEGEEGGEPAGDPPPKVTAEAAVCIALKAEGIGSVNPGHPELQALIAQGAEVQNFVSAARAAVGKGKGRFDYVLGVVKGQIADAKNLAAAGRAAPIATPGSSGSATRAARMAEARGGSRPQGDFIDTEARDVTPR